MNALGIANVLVNIQKRVSVDNLMGSPGRPRWGGMIQTLVVQSRKQTRPVTTMRETSLAPGADASDFLDMQKQWGALGGGEGPGSAAPHDDLVWVVLEDSCRLLAFAADSAQLLLKLDLFKKLLGVLELFRERECCTTRTIVLYSCRTGQRHYAETAGAARVTSRWTVILDAGD